MVLFLFTECYWLVRYQISLNIPQVFSSEFDHKLTDLKYRGFDAQVNGAMISVPSFRSNFGYVSLSAYDRYA